MTWKEKYLKNMVTLETLNRLVTSGKLTREDVDSWVQERQEQYGY